MKKLFLLPGLWCLSLFSDDFLFCQTASLCRQAVAAAGGYAFVANKNFEYTLGEPVVATIGTGATRLSQGFHQPEICALSVGTSEIAAASGLTVFPNPTTEELHLRFEAPIGQIFQLQVLYATGQLLRTLPKSDDTMASTVDCRAFPAGAYFLIARTADGGIFFRVPFVKAER